MASPSRPRTSTGSTSSTSTLQSDAMPPNTRTKSHVLANHHSQTSLSSHDLEKGPTHPDRPTNEELELMRTETRQDLHSTQNAANGSRVSNPLEDPSKVVTWDGDDDPERPMNMPTWRKWAITVTTGLMTFCVAFGSSVYTSTIFVTAGEFHVSSEVMLLGLSLYVLGFALGPMLWGPLSEVYGRTRPLWIGMIGFMCFLIPNAVAQNLQTIFISRFFAGCFGSAPLGIVSGMFVDFMSVVDRGIATAVFSSAVLTGPAVGPIVGSFITHSYLTWRWTAWITLIMTALFTVMCWLVTPETFEPTLLHWRARNLRHSTHDWALHSKSEEHRLDLSSLVGKYLTKPFVMIVKEPILVILTLYVSLVYGILYLTFEAFPISFEGTRHWTPQLASLTFVSVLIGSVAAGTITAVFTRTWYARRLAASPTGKPVPEHRIPIMMLGSILLPAGLFWFAWTSHPRVHWAAQVPSGILIGAGIVLIFQGCIVYMVDVYLMNANSAIAVNTCVRSVFGAAFPLFSTYMYAGMGVDWATSLLAFVCVALMPFPWVFWFYGERIRGWSKFAFVL